MEASYCGCGSTGYYYVHPVQCQCEKVPTTQSLLEKILTILSEISMTQKKIADAVINKPPGTELKDYSTTKQPQLTDWKYYGTTTRQPLVADWKYYGTTTVTPKVNTEFKYTTRFPPRY